MCIFSLFSGCTLSLMQVCNYEISMKLWIFFHSYYNFAKEKMFTSLKDNILDFVIPNLR
jgi:hypothetical protein